MITGLLNRLATLRILSVRGPHGGQILHRGRIRARFAADDKPALACDDSHGGLDRRDDCGGHRLR